MTIAGAIRQAFGRRRQELWCHDCSNYVQFTLDMDVDGNHVLTCPRCGHEHCRVVKRGRITDIRWDRRNGPSIPVGGFITTSAVSTYVMAGSSSVFLYDSWMTSTDST